MARKKYLWSTKDASGNLVPFCVLECSEDIATEIVYRHNRGDYNGVWKYVADNLHECYPEKFPSYFDGYNRRRLFWYNNVLESFDDGYKRMVEEVMKRLNDNFDYDNEDSLRIDAEWEVSQKLEDLPMYVI